MLRWGNADFVEHRLDFGIGHKELPDEAGLKAAMEASGVYGDDARAPVGVIFPWSSFSSGACALYPPGPSLAVSPQAFAP
jgi:hypothetical protein